MCPVVWYEALWRVLEDVKSGEIVTVLEGPHTTGEAKTAIASKGALKPQGGTSLFNSDKYLRKCGQRTHGCLHSLSEMHPCD